MNLKFLSRGEGGSSGSAKPSAKSASDATGYSELGALELTQEEIAEFEKWATQPTPPTEFMTQAAKVHRILQTKLKR